MLHGKQATNMSGVSDWGKDHEKYEIYITVSEILECVTSDMFI